MHLILQILASLATALVIYVVFKISNIAYREWNSALNALPGPPKPSFIFGNMKQIWDAEAMELHEKWVNEYGPTIRYASFAGMNKLYTTDTKALNYILKTTSVYQKAGVARENLSQLFGSGILVVEDEKHKQQRKVMNPAFGPSAIRELTEVFVEKAVLLRDIWISESQKEGTNGRVDIFSWLNRMTLDVIGLAGFNYHFDALTNDPDQNELNKAFNQVFRARTSMSLVNVLSVLVPPFRYITRHLERDTLAARRTMDRIGEQLLTESRASLSKDNGKVEKSAFKGRDLLSVLLKANMATDIMPSQRMSDAEVLAQVPTFLVAGHETTSSATTFALYALTQAPVVQAKLRQELLTISSDNPTMDELNSLPYLDAVVRETLRLHSPVTSTFRVAIKDDIIPLGTPVIGRNGERIDSVHIRKGQELLIPILSINRAESLWGEDARQFKPERWTESQTPETISAIPGVWGNIMTFLGGPRACIGYRFSLVEMKALIFTLVRAFELELAVPAEHIKKKTSLVQRPLVTSELEKGHQMPLKLKPLSRS